MSAPVKKSGRTNFTNGTEIFPKAGVLLPECWTKQRGDSSEVVELWALKRMRSPQREPITNTTGIC